MIKKSVKWTKYRVARHLLGLTDHSNIIYYDIKKYLSNVNITIGTHICPIHLYDWTLNDLTSYHDKAHLIDQSIQAGGGPPCSTYYWQFQSMSDQVWNKSNNDRSVQKTVADERVTTKHSVEFRNTNRTVNLSDPSKTNCPNEVTSASSGYSEGVKQAL